MNILIDMLCHGMGTAGYVADELLHTLNDCRFSSYKLLKYGNARRIFGASGASFLKAMRKLDKLLSASSKSLHA